MDNFITALLASITGVAFIVIGLPLALKKVKPNWFYGFRISYTLKDEEIWYAVNAQGGKDFIFVGCVLLIIGIVSAFYIGNPQIQRAFLKLMLVIMFAGIAFSVARGYTLARQLAKEKGIK